MDVSDLRIIAAALGACVAIGATGAGCSDRQCARDADCPPSQACVAGGGVFFATSTCVVTSTPSDAGIDVAMFPPDVRPDAAADADAPPDATIPPCEDGVLGERESDVDCGGSCEPCEVGGACLTGDDCVTEFCSVDETCAWPRTCADWRAAGWEVDGEYGVDTDGAGPLPPVDVYCDMTTDGGVGYTMVRLDDGSLDDQATQQAYRSTCAQLGMEVIVPRSRGHARSIVEYNGGEPPNLVNVYPKMDGAQGLREFTGICRGAPCRFWMSDTNNADCVGNEPNGDNTTADALHRVVEATDTCPFGSWDDQPGSPLAHPGWVICSTNDVGPPTYRSCLEIIDADSVQNASNLGITGFYEIQTDTLVEPVEVFCDMTSDGGGYTLLKVARPTALSAGEAEEYCNELGMQLFIPRTERHRQMALVVAGAPTVGPSGGYDYLSILGIYAGFAGARCDNRPFRSDNPDCEWEASDGGRFFVEDPNPFGEPNGSIAGYGVGNSLEYIWGSSGLEGLEDHALPGHRSERFICDVGDKQ